MLIANALNFEQKKREGCANEHLLPPPRAPLALLRLRPEGAVDLGSPRRHELPAVRRATVGEERAVVTYEEAIAWVKRITEMRGDDEAAHNEADIFYVAVLKEIATGKTDPRELAALALTTQTIAFKRWYA